MPTRTGPAAPPPRQRKRSADTRTGLLDAVVACLLAAGYSGTTFRAVAEHAGASVGALQHHFGTRDKMLKAVMEHLFGQLTERLAGLDVERLRSRGPAAAAAEIVATMWAFYGGSLNTAVLEIVTGSRTQTALHTQIRTLRENIVATYMRPWKALVGHSGLSRQQQTDLMQFSISTLRGLALMRLYQHDDQRFFARQLKLLTGVITHALATGSFPAAPASPVRARLATRRKTP